MPAFDRVVRGYQIKDVPERVVEAWDKATMRGYLRWRSARLRRLTRPSVPQHQFAPRHHRV